jgi:hypothetical protein
MPREQVMCAAVSGGSAEAVGVGLAASLNVQVLGRLENAVVAANLSASCYVARLGGAIHGASFFLSIAITPRLRCPGNIWRQSVVERAVRLFASVAARLHFWAGFGGCSRRPG